MQGNRHAATERLSAWLSQPFNGYHARLMAAGAWGFFFGVLFATWMTR